MSAAERMPPSPLYVSAREVVNLTGVSLKTVRRRIKDGTLPRVRLGRRVLIPFAALLGDDPRAQEPRPEPTEAPSMATAPTATPHRSVDPAGRLLPLTDEERRARSEALGRALDDIAGMTDDSDTDEVWRDVMRGIDETRPHRPLFEGSY
jgi:excisionase family DNA binding protein